MQGAVLADRRVWLGLLTFMGLGLAVDVIAQLTSFLTYVPAGKNFVVWKAIGAVQVFFAAALATWVARRSLLMPLLALYLLSFAFGMQVLHGISLAQTTHWQLALDNLDGAALQILALVLGVKAAQRLLVTATAADSAARK